jgi:hypothetical protein
MTPTHQINATFQTLEMNLPLAPDGTHHPTSDPRTDFVTAVSRLISGPPPFGNPVPHRTDEINPELHARHPIYGKGVMGNPGRGPAGPGTELASAAAAD